MPAVHTFALYATAAIIFNFLLQITAFIAFMTIDLTRQENGRYDILCCLKYDTDENDVHINSWLQMTFKSICTPNVLNNMYVDHGCCRKFYGFFFVIINFISFCHRIYKSIILLVFTCITCASIYLIPSIEIGLDQQLSMSKSSYVYKYFQVSVSIVFKLESI